jgi:hypothetical protein
MTDDLRAQGQDRLAETWRSSIASATIVREGGWCVSGSQAKKSPARSRAFLFGVKSFCMLNLRSIL